MLKFKIAFNVLLLCGIAFCGEGKPPTGMNESALSSLVQFTKGIFQDDPTVFGFAKNDRPEDLTLGEPVEVKRLMLDGLQNFKKGMDIDMLKCDQSNPAWVAVVFSKGEIRMLAEIALLNGRWQVVKLCCPGIAEVIQNLIDKYGKNNLQLFRFAPFGSYFFNLRSKGKDNLTRLEFENRNVGSVGNKTIQSRQMEITSISTAIDSLKKEVEYYHLIAPQKNGGN